MKTTDRQLKCRGLFEALGYPVSGASALVGNFCRESGPDLPTAFRRTHLDHGSNGLAQWRAARLVNLTAFVTTRHPRDAQAWLGNMGEQVAFVDYELRTDYPALHAKLMRGGDVAALTADVCWQYERPNKALSGISIRLDYAKALAAHGTVATKQSGVSTLTLAPLNVVDHLQVAADAHAKQQTGGAVLASGGILVGAGAALAQFAGSVPVWELALGGVSALAVAIGITASVVAGHKASSIRTAISGVTPDAPPADDVDHTPVEAPAAPVSATAGLTEEDIQRIVRTMIAAGDGPGAPAPVDIPAMGLVASQSSVEASGATMSVGRGMPVEGVK